MKPILSISLLIFMLVANACYPVVEKPPNVIYIWIEDMGPFLGCYGDTFAKAPEIDSFAQDAVQFEDVHCQVF